MQSIEGLPSYTTYSSVYSDTGGSASNLDGGGAGDSSPTGKGTMGYTVLHINPLSSNSPLSHPGCNTPL